MHIDIIIHWQARVLPDTDRHKLSFFSIFFPLWQARVLPDTDRHKISDDGGAESHVRLYFFFPFSFFMMAEPRVTYAVHLWQQLPFQEHAA